MGASYIPNFIRLYRRLKIVVWKKNSLGECSLKKILRWGNYIFLMQKHLNILTQWEIPIKKTAAMKWPWILFLISKRSWTRNKIKGLNNFAFAFIRIFCWSRIFDVSASEKSCRLYGISFTSAFSKWISYSTLLSWISSTIHNVFEVRRSNK